MWGLYRARVLVLRSVCISVCVCVGRGWTRIACRRSKAIDASCMQAKGELRPRPFLLSFLADEYLITSVITVITELKIKRISYRDA